MPFNSDNKYSAVAVNHKGENGNIEKVALYIKGAPAIIMQMCPHALSQNGIIQTNEVLHESNGVNVTYRNDFEAKVNDLAGMPYRVISFAYAELVEKDWESMAK